MKKLFFIVSFASLVMMQSNAAVLLVNNSAQSPGQYTTFATAMAAAAANDTIYIQGTNTNYGDLVVTHAICIIGPGANPEKQTPLSANVGGLTFSAGGFAGFKVKGLVFNTNNVVLSAGLNNLEIEDCYFSNMRLLLANNCTNMKISNCIFTSTSHDIDGADPCSGWFTGCANLLIQNCIFNGSVAGINMAGAVIQNNLFLYTAAFNSNNLFNNGGCYTAWYNSACIIQNNIFLYQSPTLNASACSFNNNITYNPSAPFAGGDLLGGTNLDNTDPQFINAPSVGTQFGWGYNYGVLAASPAHHTGTDGTDMGFYGGSFPASKTGEVFMQPVIRQMNVQNVNVPQSGNVNVKVRSTISRTGH